jgi:hypothetical protein
LDWFQRKTDFGFEALELNYWSVGGGYAVLCFLVIRFDDVEELLAQVASIELSARERARLNTLRWGIANLVGDPWKSWQLDSPEAAVDAAADIEATIRRHGFPFFREHRTLVAAFEFLRDEEQGMVAAQGPLPRCINLVALSFLMNDHKAADDVVADCRDYLRRHPQAGDLHIRKLEGLQFVNDRAVLDAGARPRGTRRVRSWRGRTRSRYVTTRCPRAPTAPCVQRDRGVA